MGSRGFFFFTLIYSTALYNSGCGSPSTTSSAIAPLIIMAILLRPFALTLYTIVPLPIAVVGWSIIAFDFISLPSQTNINHLAHICGYIAVLFLFFIMERNEKKALVKGLVINILLAIAVFLFFFLGIANKLGLPSFFPF